MTVTWPTAWDLWRTVLNSISPNTLFDNIDGCIWASRILLKVKGAKASWAMRSVRWRDMWRDGGGWQYISISQSIYIYIWYLYLHLSTYLSIYLSIYKYNMYIHSMATQNPFPNQKLNITKTVMINQSSCRSTTPITPICNTRSEYPKIIIYIHT